LTVAGHGLIGQVPPDLPRRRPADPLDRRPSDTDHGGVPVANV
jgi:hypothetical protein